MLRICCALLIFFINLSQIHGSNLITWYPQVIVEIKSIITGKEIYGHGFLVADQCSFSDLNDIEKHMNCKWYILSASHVSGGPSNKDTSIIINHKEYKKFKKRVADFINDIELLEIEKEDFINPLFNSNNSLFSFTPSQKYLIYPAFLFREFSSKQNENQNYSWFDYKNLFNSSENLKTNFFMGKFSNSLQHLSRDFNLNGIVKIDQSGINFIEPINLIKVSRTNEISLFNTIFAFISNSKIDPSVKYNDQCYKNSYFIGSGDRLMLHCSALKGMSGGPVFQVLNNFDGNIFYLRGIITQFDRDFNTSIIASHHAISKLMNQMTNNEESRPDEFQWKYDQFNGTYRSSNIIEETILTTIPSGDHRTIDGGDHRTIDGGKSQYTYLNENLHSGICIKNEISLSCKNVIGFKVNNSYISASINSWHELKNSNLLNDKNLISSGDLLTEIPKQRYERFTQSQLRIPNIRAKNNSTITEDTHTLSTWYNGFCKIKLNKLNTRYSFYVTLKTEDSTIISFELNEDGTNTMIGSTKQYDDKTKINFFPRFMIKDQSGTDYIIDYQGLFFSDPQDIAYISKDHFLFKKVNYPELISTLYSHTPPYLKVRRKIPITDDNSNSCLEFYACQWSY